MEEKNNNWIWWLVLVVVALLFGWWVFGGTPKSEKANEGEGTTKEETGQSSSTTKETATTTSPATTGEEIIGKSAQGRDITASHFGSGSDEILVIGGVHGAYSWNTVILADELEKYFTDNKNIIPANIKLTIIKELNIDGIVKVIGNNESFDFKSASAALLASGRFNGNNVDLSRNFDCGWKAEGVWQNKKVSGGTAPFSESESQALRNYVETHKPKAVVVYYSAAGGVYSSQCGAGILSETATLNSTYAKAADYPSYNKFNAYPTSGDLVDWLAKINVPAISVLLTNHTDIELDKNLAGVKAVLAKYAK